MTDEYAREVIRDAIPLLEQLLERLKILAGIHTITVRLSDLPDPLAPLPPDATDAQRANRAGLMHSLDRIWNMDRHDEQPSQEC